METGQCAPRGLCPWRRNALRPRPRCSWSAVCLGICPRSLQRFRRLSAPAGASLPGNRIQRCGFQSKSGGKAEGGVCASVVHAGGAALYQDSQIAESRRSYLGGRPAPWGGKFAFGHTAPVPTSREDCPRILGAVSELQDERTASTANYSPRWHSPPTCWAAARAANGAASG